MASGGKQNSSFKGSFSINNILGLEREDSRANSETANRQPGSSRRPTSPSQHKCQNPAHRKSPNSRQQLEAFRFSEGESHSPNHAETKDAGNYVKHRLQSHKVSSDKLSNDSVEYSTNRLTIPTTAQRPTSLSLESSASGIHLGNSDPYPPSTLRSYCESVSIPSNFIPRSQHSTRSPDDNGQTHMIWSPSEIGAKHRDTPSPDMSDYSDKFSESDDRFSGEDAEDEHSGSDRKKKKTRTVFSRRQIFELETMFDMKRYLTSAERSRLAHALQMSETQVKIWFQNRRNKWKRHLAENEPQSPYSYAKTDYVIPSMGIPKPMHAIQGLVATQPMYYTDNRLRKCFPVLYGQTPIELTHL